MWRLYLKSDEGIAIQTTGERFAESFYEYPDPIFIGEVSYIDYDTFAEFKGNLFEFALLKRMSYSHEKEIRAVHALHETHDGKKFMSVTPGPPGKGIPVNLDQLIEAVFVAPKVHTWVVDLVRTVVERYGLNVPVIHSDLAKPPC
jgi:hypothetical protein